MKKLVSVLFLMLFVIQLINFVSAQSNLTPDAPPIPTPQREDDATRRQEIQNFAEQRAKEDFIFGSTLVVILLISLVLWSFIVKKMIKKNPKIINWIIHILVLIGSIAIFSVTLIDTVRCLKDNYCGLHPILWVLIVTSLFSLCFSSLTIKKIVKERTKSVYSINMSGGVIFLGFIFNSIEAIVEIILWHFQLISYDLPLFIFLWAFTIPIMLGLYVLLGIIGHFIDKRKK